MKNLKFITLLLLSTVVGFSQDHFAGLSTSSRVGILNTYLNPAEIVNLSNKFEIDGLGMSVSVSNNKIGYSDLFSDTNLESALFRGSDPVNMTIDAEIHAIGFAMKFKNWGFGITTTARGKMDVVDVDPKLGDALSNSGGNSIIGNSIINSNYNQRLNGTTWGEVGFTVARSLKNTEKYKLNLGATFKLLFPGSYTNMGLDKFNGTITNTGTQLYLTNTTANLNFAYSGGLANNFSNLNDYSQSVFGGLHGFSGDIGINFQWKDKSIFNLKKNSNKYKINAGIAIRNIGSMTFKDPNNNSSNYELRIQGSQSLNLNQFQNVDNTQQIETILLNSGFLTKTQSNKDFTIKLPTLFSAYADVKIISKLYVSGYIQQKLNDNNSNDQISVQNSFTITPRANFGFFEVFSPWSKNAVSGLNGGIGFRLGGYYIGSGSLVTALINDSKQADIYTGFRWSFL
jgi:hypothetical protein